MTETAKSRSYKVQETIPEGTVVEVLETIVRRRPINHDWDNLEVVTVEEGEMVRITYYSNAGFRGIEASIQLADGSLLHGVSAGLLDTI
jgi:hypothetical protein